VTSFHADTEPSNAVPAPFPVGARPDSLTALQGFVLLDAVIRLLVWSAALAVATATFTAAGAWPDRGLVGADLGLAWRWGRVLTGWVVLFNLVYVAELVVLRLPIPTPKQGRYPTGTRRPNRQLLWSCLIATLTKARYQAPFPGFLVFHVANLPPMRWVMGAVFGPRSRSCNVTDPQILDPYLVRLGRNVVIGFNATLAGHCQDRDSVLLRQTTIEDDVVIGAHAFVFGGAHIRSGSVIGAGAVVLPETVIGPNELWAGVPAKKIRDLPPPGTPVASEQTA